MHKKLISIGEWKYDCNEWASGWRGWTEQAGGVFKIVS
jgi:hypothetical protein